MTGLQKELQKSKRGKVFICSEINSKTYTGIAKILGLTYPTAKRKVENNSFTIDEAMSIYTILFAEHNDFNYFKYLFTNEV